MTALTVVVGVLTCMLVGAVITVALYPPPKGTRRRRRR